MKTMNVLPNGNVEVFIPFQFARQSGRRKMHTEDEPTTANDTLIQLIAKANALARQVENGTYATNNDLAKTIHMDASRLNHFIRLSYLSPRIVEMILDGTAPESVTVQKLFALTSLVWAEQHKALGID